MREMESLTPLPLHGRTTEPLQESVLKSARRKSADPFHLSLGERLRKPASRGIAHRVDRTGRKAPGAITRPSTLEKLGHEPAPNLSIKQIVNTDLFKNRRSRGEGVNEVTELAKGKHEVYRVSPEVEQPGFFVANINSACGLMAEHAGNGVVELRRLNSGDKERPRFGQAIAIIAV